MISTLFSSEYFPKPANQIPFGEFIEGVFFNPIGDNEDYPIHGPNVIRLTEALLSGGQGILAPGLIKGTNEEKQAAEEVYLKNYSAIQENLGNDSPNEKKKVLTLLKIAALYHDIGKHIRRANHPQIGANLIRNYNQVEQQNLVELLTFGGTSNPTSKHSRFALITSIVQHHDKFGVVSTGEGGLPIFSDILYFTSDQNSKEGIKKNITSVMLMNLADIAAVNIASKPRKAKSLNLAREVFHLRNHPKTNKKSNNTNKTEEGILSEIIEICKDESSCLGLNERKVANVLQDWNIIIDAIDHESVQGNRVKLKEHLLNNEKNPARAIQRILRLIQEAALTTNAKEIIDIKYITLTTVESVLVGTLGGHQFQSFCELFATVVKLDYGLNFFKSIMCACIRKIIHPDYKIIQNSSKKLSWNKLEDYEHKKLLSLSDETKSDLARKITVLYIKVLAGLIARYSGVLDYSSSRRFGFQMRDLTLDEKIRDTIINLLCIEENKDSIALTWIADEVTIWSFD